MTTRSLRKSTGTKIAAPLLGLGLALGATACGEESAGPEEGATLEDLNSAEEGGGEEEEAGVGVGEEEESGDGGGLTEDDIAEAPNPGDIEDDTDEFFNDPAALLNENVTVSGTVVEVLSPEAIVIGQEDLATLVVFGPSVNLEAPEPGQVAQVTGDVGTFVLADVEADLGIDLADEDFVDFQQAPFIAAQNLNILDSEGEGGGAGGGE